MSCYFSIYVCDLCQYRVPIGLMGIELNRTVAFCTSCSASFDIYPEPEETLLANHKPHRLFVFGSQRVEVSSKKGRIKKTVLEKAWVDSGLRIPIREDIREREDDLYLVYSFIFDDVHCPNCQTKGSLVEDCVYVKTCPKCHVGTMSEHEL